MLRSWLSTIVDPFFKRARLSKHPRSSIHTAVINNDKNTCDSLLQSSNSQSSQVDAFGFTPRQLSMFLGRDIPVLMHKKQVLQSTILVYRQQEARIVAMAISEFEKRLTFKYACSLIFDEINTLDAVAWRCSRQLKYPHLKKMNDWAMCLFKHAINTPRDHLYYIRWINAYLGYGVFAASDIPAKTYLGEYTGLVKKRRRRKNLLNDYVFSYDICSQSTPWCIDAQSIGNFTRFLNHSDQANLMSRWLIKEGVTHIIFFSNRFIKKHSQLTYCYGPWYWKTRPQPSNI